RSGFNKVNAIAKPVSFVASEEEAFVLHDRAAHRTSELIHPQWKLGVASRPHAIEKVPRIQLVVPEKFERRTVEGIAAGLRNNANLASATCAEFGTIGIGFDTKLLNVFEAALQFERRRHLSADHSGFRVNNSGSFNAVITNGILVGCAAVKPNVIVLAVTGVLCAGSLQVQLRQLSAVDRKGGHFTSVHACTHSGG